MVFTRSRATDARSTSSSGSVDQKKVFSMIQKKAYDLYAKRGNKTGNDKADWFEAERQVKRELGIK